MSGHPVDTGTWHPDFFDSVKDAWQKDRLNLLLVWLDGFAKKIKTLKDGTEEKTSLTTLYKQLTALFTKENIADFNKFTAELLKTLSAESTEFLKDASARLAALKPILIADEKKLTPTERQFSSLEFINDLEETMVKNIKSPDVKRFFSNMQIKDSSWKWHGKLSSSAPSRRVSGPVFGRNIVKRY